MHLDTPSARGHMAPRARAHASWLVATALLLVTACGGGDGRTITVPGTGAGTPPSRPDGGVQPIEGTPGEGMEIVADFGVQTLSGGVTDRLSVRVPDNAISLTLEGVGPAGSTFGLGELIGPNGREYENTALTGAYIWVPGAEAFSTTVPNTDRASVQLVAGGGDYLFRIRRMTGPAQTVAVRAIVETRAPVETDVATLDLNVWLADGIAPTAADASSDGRLQAILARIDEILAGRGIRLGAIAYYDTDAAFDEIRSEAQFAQLLRTTSTAADVHLNLFFVNVAFGGGVVGAAAAVAGPKRNGTSVSGVMCVYGGFGANTVGLIAAHEIGHYLGLLHTVEQSGQHDFIDDTPNCPATDVSAACPTLGGGLLMHWQAVGGTRLTAGQGLVLRAHPLCGPRATTSTKTQLRRARAFTPAEWIEVGGLAPHWCAACASRRVK